MRYHVVSSTAFLVMLSAALPLSAQYDRSSGAAFSGTGVSEIERMPEKMRLQVSVLSKASTLKEALANLKTRVEAARRKVTNLGAKADTIKVEPARVSSDKSDQQKRMEMMVTARMQGKGKKGPKTPKVQPVTVSATLSAEFPLKSKEHEPLLIEAQALQESIKAADLAGRQEAVKLTAEEQELQEEMSEQGMSMSYGSEEEVKPGDPMFMFVSAISSDERDKALANAFKKANADAAQLAKAAGKELGVLTHVSSNMVPGLDSDEYSSYGGNSSYRYQMAVQRMRGAGGQAKKDDLLEAIGITAGKVKCTLTISVGYAIGGK